LLYLLPFLSPVQVRRLLRIQMCYMRECIVRQSFSVY
jgi:hypothetical protein